MDSLVIKSTPDCPEISFDTTTHHFLISGESRPENAGKFYSPLIDWLKDYENILYWRKNELKDNAAGVFFKFKLGYFNSTSAKWLMDILLLLKKYTDSGYSVNIEWHYSSDNEDMLDAGNEFADMVNMDFKFIEN